MAFFKRKTQNHKAKKLQARPRVQPNAKVKDEDLTKEPAQPISTTSPAKRATIPPPPPPSSRANHHRPASPALVRSRSPEAFVNGLGTGCSSPIQTSVNARHPPWATPPVDRLLCALDARDLGGPEIIRRIKAQFPALRTVVLTNAMVDTRIRLLDERVDIDYFKYGLGMGARSIEDGIGLSRGARHGAAIHAGDSLSSNLAVRSKASFERGQSPLTPMNAASRSAGLKDRETTPPPVGKSMESMPIAVSSGILEDITNTHTQSGHMHRQTGSHGPGLPNTRAARLGRAMHQRHGKLHVLNGLDIETPSSSPPRPSQTPNKRQSVGSHINMTPLEFRRKRSGKKGAITLPESPSRGKASTGCSTSELTTGLESVKVWDEQSENCDSC